MPIGLLGIATGAVNIGKKIFGGIKRRQEKRIAKKAQNLLESQTRLSDAARKFGFTPTIVDDEQFDLSQVNSLINPQRGSLALSSAANALFAVKGGDAENVRPSAANVALEERAKMPGPGNVNPMILIGGALVLILLFISKRR